MLCRSIRDLFRPRSTNSSWQNRLWICLWLLIWERFFCRCRPCRIINARSCKFCNCQYSLRWWTSIRSRRNQERWEWYRHSIHRWSMSLWSRLRLDMLRRPLWYLLWTRSPDPSGQNRLRICIRHYLQCSSILQCGYLHTSIFLYRNNGFSWGAGFRSRGRKERWQWQGGAVYWWSVFEWCGLCEYVLCGSVWDLFWAGGADASGEDWMWVCEFEEVV
jgi:hypothetical protein